MRASAASERYAPFFQERMVLEEILESSLLMVVAPNQSEMAAVLAIFDVMPLGLGAP